MDLQSILLLLCEHRDQIITKKEAIATGTEDANPNYLYYLDGMLDEVNVQIEIFQEIIRSNAECVIKANELFGKLKRVKQ